MDKVLLASLDQGVYSVAINNNNSIIACGLRNGDIVTWCGINLNELQSITNCEDEYETICINELNNIIFSIDCTLLISSTIVTNKDMIICGIVNIWNSQTLTKVCDSIYCKQRVSSMGITQLSNNTIALGLATGTIKLYNIITTEFTIIKTNPFSAIIDFIAFVKDDTCIAWPRNMSTYITDIKTNTCIYTLEYNRIMHISNNKNYLSTMQYYTIAVNLSNLNTMQLQTSYKIEESPLAILTNRDGTRLITLINDKIIVYDTILQKNISKEQLMFQIAIMLYQYKVCLSSDDSILVLCKDSRVFIIYNPFKLVSGSVTKAANFSCN